MASEKKKRKNKVFPFFPKIGCWAELIVPGIFFFLAHIEAHSTRIKNDKLFLQGRRETPRRAGLFSWTFEVKNVFYFVQLTDSRKIQSCLSMSFPSLTSRIVKFEEPVGVL